MAPRFRESYRFETGLEQAVLDLVRVGATGYGSGVRQLATRLMRAVPPGVTNPADFRARLHEAITEGTPSTGLRYAIGEVPADPDGTHPLVSVDPLPDGSGLVLPAPVASAFDDIVREHEQSDALLEAGVSPTRTLLLSGPPGVGKTRAAHWLAQQIGVPIVTMDLSSVVSSYLGTSGRNIRSVLEYAKSGRCVLLLDEFDAIAKRRDDDTDIGELKRIVNVVLMELDRWPDSSLLVAATNHPQLLDAAVDRRFDQHIRMPIPDKSERERILRNLCGKSDVSPSILTLVADLTEGSNGSDLTRMWNHVVRRSIIHARSLSDELLEEMAARARASGSDRDKLWRMLADDLGLSIRQIAARAGVSHPTVSSAIKRAREAS